MADDRKVLGGNVLLKIDGALVKTVPGTVELEYGGATRETKMADGKFHYREEPKASMVKAKLAHVAATDIKKINDLAGGMVEIVTDIGGGITYRIENATRTGDPIKSAASDGTIDFQAEGDPVPDL